MPVQQVDPRIGASADVPKTELVGKGGQTGRILIKESLAQLGLTAAKLLWATQWPTDSTAHALRMAIMAGVRTGDTAVECLGITHAFLEENEAEDRGIRPVLPKDVRQ